MTELYGFFAVNDDGFLPCPIAASQWSSDQVVGLAVCGLLARELENSHGTSDFTPVRLTVDMFRPARMHELSVSTSLVRDGRRIRVADAVLVQEGAPMARASVVFLRPSQQPPGKVWTPERQPVAPPPEIAPPGVGPDVPLWGSDARCGWSRVYSEHENASRKRSWQYQFDVVVGEEPSPFVRAAMAAEHTATLTNWSDAGIGFINADLTVGLARMPVGVEIGVEADNQLSADGIAVGTATLFDRDGSFGTALVTAVANAARQISVHQLDGVSVAASPPR